jgi:glutamate synthase (NADPH/NADH) small chain
MNNEEAILEAKRCLNCKNPRCVESCPMHTNIPAFINEIKNGDINKAHSSLLAHNIFSSICSEICPAEKQCQKGCVCGIKGKPIQIQELEHFVNENAPKFNLAYNPFKVTNTVLRNKRIAVIGTRSCFFNVRILPSKK